MFPAFNIYTKFPVVCIGIEPRGFCIFWNRKEQFGYMNTY